jgi:polyisoprenoid-binding protein YceI
MSTTTFWRAIVVILSGSAAGICIAEPVTYEIEPGHTYPSFEADHWHGLSIWRGKINRSSGMIVLDREAETGSLVVEMDMSSIDFGHDEMNERAVNDIFHVSEYPTARYTGTLVDFEDGAPTAVEGTLTMHGMTRALDLTISHFQCQPHFRSGVEVCGAAAETTLNRSDYGVIYDLDNGFFPEVNLSISVEGRRLESE